MGDVHRTGSEQGPSWARVLIAVGAAMALVALGLLAWTLTTGGMQLADPDTMQVPAGVAVSAGLLFVSTVLVGVASAGRSLSPPR